VPAAAAVELALTAGDVVDDVVDEEWAGSDLSRARSLNASLALLQLGQVCISHLAESLGPARALLVGRILSDGILSACGGEDLDLLLELEPRASEEAAYEMTSLKSGSLVAMACQAGAAVATDDEAQLNLAGEFGRHLGVIAQILNDIHGISDGGSDLRRRKKTLPVAYALRCASEEGIRTIADWYEGQAVEDQVDEVSLAKLIIALGGVDFAWVVAETQRGETVDILRQLATYSGRQQVLELSELIPPLHARPGPNTTSP
jgi:geranylgeranyl pyrophosphate synthase